MLQPRPGTSLDAPRPVCASCGDPVAGAYCSACGQRVLRERHTLLGFVRAGGALTLDLDRGFLHTGWRLLVAPATVIRDFLAGATVRYTHPVAWLLIAFAAFAVTGRLAGGEAGLADGSNRLMTATAVPVIALVSRVVFWRARLNYAEHLVVTSYLLGTVLLGLAALQALTPLVPLALSTNLGLGGLIAGLGYFVFAYTRVFGRTPWRAAAGALLTLAGGIALWLLALLQLLSLYRSAK